MTPTGSLTLVAKFMRYARCHESNLEAALETEEWTSAIEQKLQAERCKARAGVEFLLWFGAVSAMPPEPKPWDELQAKLAKEQEEKEKENG